MDRLHRPRGAVSRRSARQWFLNLNGVTLAGVAVHETVIAPEERVNRLILACPKPLWSHPCVGQGIALGEGAVGLMPTCVMSVIQACPATLGTTASIPPTLSPAPMLTAAAASDFVLVTQALSRGGCTHAGPSRNKITSPRPGAFAQLTAPSAA